MRQEKVAISWPWGRGAQRRARYRQYSDEARTKRLTSEQALSKTLQGSAPATRRTGLSMMHGYAPETYRRMTNRYGHTAPTPYQRTADVQGYDQTVLADKGSLKKHIQMVMSTQGRDAALSELKRLQSSSPEQLMAIGRKVPGAVIPEGTMLARAQGRLPPVPQKVVKYKGRGIRGEVNVVPGRHPTGTMMAKNYKPIAKPDTAVAKAPARKVTESVKPGARTGGGGDFVSRLARAAVFIKAAKSRRLGEISSTPGPEQIEQALRMYQQARMLARPTRKTLRQHGLSDRDFRKRVKRLSRDKGDRFDFSSKVPNPRLRAAGGALAGGLVGHKLGLNAATDDTMPILKRMLGYLGPVAALGLTGGLAGKMTAERDRKKMLGTAKLLKDYGLLTPQLLRKASPVII